MNIYLLGDSHATEIAQSRLGDGMHHQTLLGYGLQSLAGASKHRQMSIEVKKHVESVLCNIPKASLVFLSYTDSDGRIGMGAESYDLHADYSSALAWVKKCTDSKIVLLDWYTILDKSVHEQTCSVEQRRKHREHQLMVLSDLRQDVDTTMNDDFARFVRDDVHYDFNQEELRSELEQRVRYWREKHAI